MDNYNYTIDQTPNTIKERNSVVAAFQDCWNVESMLHLCFTALILGIWLGMVLFSR